MTDVSSAAQCFPPDSGRASRLSAHTRHQLTDLAGDDFLDRFAERAGAAVIHHRPSALVAAFLEYAVGRDVAHHVVRIPGDPRRVPAILRFQAQAVIDDGLASECDQREAGAEPPDLHRVRIAVVDLAVAVEHAEQQLRVARAHAGRRFEDGLELLAGRRRLKRDVDVIEGRRQGPRHRAHLSGGRPATRRAP